VDSELVFIRVHKRLEETPKDRKQAVAPCRAIPPP
jgi:hypothetical protein